jgi:hypothetical protein
MRFGMGRLEISLTLWVFFLPAWHWIGRWIVLRMRIHPSLAILDAFKEDFILEIKVACLKSKARWRF